MADKLNIVSGDVFGEFTVISEAEKYKLPSGQKNRAMVCKCSCGKIKTIRLLHLVRGRIRSCGCLGSERHGMTKDKLYMCWKGMKERATSSKCINAKRYIERGIGVCEEWLRFIPFKDWALQNGWKEGLQLDRKENNRGYYPDNCRFVTCQVNACNKEITIYIEYNNEKISLALLLFQKNLTYHYRTIYNRIKRGWNAQKAIDTKIREGNYKRKVRIVTEAA